MILKSAKKVIAGIVAFATAVAVAMIALNAPIMAVFAAGFLIISGVVLLDRKDRRMWEQSVSYELKRIRDGQKDLKAFVSHAQEDIASLKSHMKDTAQEARLARKAVAVSAASIQNPAPAAVSQPAPAPRPQNYKDFISSEEISDDAVRALTVEAIRSQRIELFLQPVVRLPQRKVRFYELYARIRARPGLYLPASRYLKLAQEARQMHQIDSLLLVECLAIIRETASIDRAAPFFINISSSSLKNAAYMKKLLAFVGHSRMLAPRLIFEITQADYETLEAPVMQIMRGLGKLGCEFSIDNVRSMAFDILALQKLKIRYIKISAKMMVPGIGQDKKFAEMLRMKRKLEGNGIAVIAEKIENERSLREILDFDVNYGQGHLFGKPDVQTAYQQQNNARTRRFI